MSPLMQEPDPHSGRERDLSASAYSNGSARTPQNWYHRTLNRSVPNLAKAQHPNRARGFSSIKELAKNSRQVLSTVSTSHRQSWSLTSNETTSSKHDGPLTHLPGSSSANTCKPPDRTSQLSNHDSFESSTPELTPDHSGHFNDTSNPATPSPARHPLHPQAVDTDDIPLDSMGNHVSSISAVSRKPLPLREKKSLLAFPTDTKDPCDPSPEQTSEKGPPPVLRHRASSPRVAIPRRRSSLTALHLDSSHFDTPVSNQVDLTQRTSTLRNSIRPAATSPSTITPTTQSHKRDTLSPTLLSPQLSASRPSSSSSNTPSPSSPAPPHIHLPPTFPDGPVPTPAPPLTTTHYKCYQSHRRVMYSRNKICPVPCMACGGIEGEGRWKCVWCALRVCGDCMAAFDARRRDLEILMGWLENAKEQKATRIGEGEMARVVS